MEHFGVSSRKEKALRERMTLLGILERDISESFIRSSGPGGQHVNKVSTGVYLKHIPTGVEVKCSSQRFQSLNRFMARRILASKIETMMLGEASEERRLIEKLRRQKRRRSKRAKEKMLKGKKIRSEKKALRKKVGQDDL